MFHWMKKGSYTLSKLLLAKGEPLSLAGDETDRCSCHGLCPSRAGSFCCPVTDLDFYSVLWDGVLVAEVTGLDRLLLIPGVSVALPLP